MPDNDYSTKSTEAAKKLDTPEVEKAVKKVMGAADEKPKIEPVAKAVERKKGLGRRIMENFTGDDAGSVGQYVLFEVLLPAAKSAISDAVSQGIERMLFGTESRSYGRSRGAAAPRVNYGGMSQVSSRRDREYDRDRRTTARVATTSAPSDIRDLVFESRADAEEVLERLVDRIGRYDFASVGDLYSAAGVTASFTDEKYGWTDLRGSAVRRISSGFVLDLPRPVPVN